MITVIHFSQLVVGLFDGQVIGLLELLDGLLGQAAVAAGDVAVVVAQRRQVLLEGADPASLAVMTFDNGTCTVNTETCEALGLDYAAVEAAFAPLCTQVLTTITAESFSDVQ